MRSTVAKMEMTKLRTLTMRRTESLHKKKRMARGTSV